MYGFEKTIDGIIKYINSEMLSGMNDLQDFFARVLIGRAIQNKDNIKNALINNGFIRSFGIIDSEGMVDVEGLARDIKTEIARKEKISLKFPYIGTYTFYPSDVDALYKIITGEDIEHHEDD